MPALDNAPSRKTSALLSGAVGAAVCLTGGGAAVAVTGNIAASNGDNNFVDFDTMKAFGNLVQWNLTTLGANSDIAFSSDLGSPLINASGVYIRTHAAGDLVSAGMVGGFATLRLLKSSISDKYLAVSFNAGGAKFGWIHIVSSNATADAFSADKWGFDQTGGNIFTLSNTVAAKCLTLADGKTMLHWTNSNEAGVALYTVQIQEADGTWRAIQTETPGSGRYSATVAATGVYRLVTERVDGSSETVDFSKPANP